MNTKIFAAAAAVMALGLAAAPANAAVTGVSSLAALGATDSIDWGQLGVDGSVVSGAGAVVTSALGQTATVTSGGDMTVMTQASSWNGNFANGEHLLWTGGNGPDITLTFANAVSAVGAQFQADFFGAFTAELIGSNGAVLGSFALGGDSNSNNDNSAVFVGLQSTSADIKQVQFHLTSASNAPNDFSIGTVSFASGGAVPEPATWALMLGGFGLAGVALRRRRELGVTA